MLSTRCKNYHFYELSGTGQEIQKVRAQQLGNRILMIGSGILECQLAEQGKEVIIVERSDELLLECLNSSMRVELMKKIEKLIILFYLETTIIKVEKDQVHLVNQENFKTSLTIDNIIVPKHYEFS